MCLFCLFTGIVCIILAIVIMFLDLRFPDNISVFFGIDPLADYEEYHLSKYSHQFSIVIAKLYLALGLGTVVDSMLAHKTRYLA